jgi:FkbM family methyltransferase
MSPRKLIRLLLFTRNLRTALSAWRSQISWLHLEKRGKTVVMKGTDIPCEQLPTPLPEGLSYQIGFLAPFGFKFEVGNDQGKNTILVDTGQVKLWLDGADVTFIVEEVFGTLEYGVVLPESAIVIDVGANVATTALYFAKEQTVKRVIAFEPFSDAIQRAERNLALNPEIASKIEIRRYALGDSNGTAYLQVDPKLSTINKILSAAAPEDPSPQQIPVQIRDAETELESVISQTDENDRIILKMDCEGSEKEIFERLSGETISRIEVMLVEWHHPQILNDIQKKLQSHGFHLLVRRSGEKDRGMLYAFRK